MSEDFEPRIWYRQVNSFTLKVSLWQRIKWKFRRNKYGSFTKAYEELSKIDISKMTVVKRLEND